MAELNREPAYDDKLPPTPWSRYLLIQFMESTPQGKLPTPHIMRTVTHYRAWASMKKTWCPCGRALRKISDLFHHTRSYKNRSSSEVESASTLILLLMDLPEYGILSDQSKEIKRKLAVGVGATVKKKKILKMH